MTKLTTDSPLSRCITRSFLDFLNSVEPAPGVDLEGLEVAKECLEEVFKIDPSSVDNQEKYDLINLFSSWEASQKQEHRSDLGHERLSADAPSTSLTEIDSVPNHSETPQALGKERTRDAHTLTISEDELFGQFFGALEKIHYFKPASDGHDDQDQLDRATHLFHNAAMEMQKSGCQTFDQKNLAETFKSQGNRAMQSKSYSDAIELYSFAIALYEDNAVYHCNRAAAYTQIHQYAEAIRDCLKSIDINPSYSKAYSRLGFAYYAQGNFRDAINKGFMKALQLDPNNESVKENIRVAEQKLKEEQRRLDHHQPKTGNDVDKGIDPTVQRGQKSMNSSSGSHQESNQQSGRESRSHSMPPSFTSMPFNINGLPSDFANMFMNMAANVHEGQHSQDRQEADHDTDAPDQPEINIGSNINFNFGEQMPEDLTGTLRSVMQMFSGASPYGNQTDDINGRSSSPSGNQQDT